MRRLTAMLATVVLTVGVFAVISAPVAQAAPCGGTYTIAYGAIAVGAIQFLYGLFKHLGAKPEPATVSNPVMLSLHAMAYVASGDGNISASGTFTSRKRIEMGVFG